MKRTTTTSLRLFSVRAFPPGRYKNGAPHAVIKPTIAGGKGWGPFDFQSTLGIGVPVEDPHTVGTPSAWNTAVQYQVLKKLWPELEANATIYPNGPNFGHKQLFLSPGWWSDASISGDA
jgi:hypothetical protein